MHENMHFDNGLDFPISMGNKTLAQASPLNRRRSTISGEQKWRWNYCSNDGRAPWPLNYVVHMRQKMSTLWHWHYLVCSSFYPNAIEFYSDWWHPSLPDLQAVITSRKASTLRKSCGSCINIGVSGEGMARMRPLSLFTVWKNQHIFLSVVIF